MPSHRSPRTVGRCFVLALCALSFPGLALAEPAPSATLLVPYFRVDLETFGETTLLAIGNDALVPTAAHVVVWTDWAIPTLSFTIGLRPNQVQTINLRDVFSGVLPVTSGLGIPGCSDPVEVPSLDSNGLAELRRKHTGEPSTAGVPLVYASPGEPTVARGFVTVDALNRCPSQLGVFPTHDPTAAGDYFTEAGSGLASNANVLWGDFFFANPADGFAQGNTAVHLVADASLDEYEGFYSRYMGRARWDRRRSPATCYRARFLNGGVFAARTLLVTWLAPLDPVEPRPVGQPFDSSCRGLRIAARDESATVTVVPELTIPAYATRYVTGEGELGDLPAFGSLTAGHIYNFSCGTLVPPDPQPVPLLVLSVHRADGFSVGLEAVASPSDRCFDP